jgi:hypothetical protein
MRRVFSTTWLVLALATLLAWPSMVLAQGAFQLVTGDEFKKALPKDFYLEGNAIPTQERNAALMKTPAGARALVALIDTTGYSSQIQQKYEGMLITEGGLSLCGTMVRVGSYGFGLARPTPPSDADAKFFLYNQAGRKVAECVAKKDNKLEQPVPLKVVVGEGAAARLYLTRYWLELK